MYQSAFSYNITRPYPFRWFTFVAVIGGIIAIALVSFLNVAATGYELFAVSSSNANSTVENHTWFGKWPSFLVSARASCEAATIPLQTKLYTNNTAFPYSLYSVWTLDENHQKIQAGSLVYSGQTLQKCNITTITINIDVDGRSASQMTLIPVGAALSAPVDCAIDTPQGRTYFTLFATFDPIPPPGDASAQFLARNSSTKASLYWGESIMRLAWASMIQEYTVAMAESNKTYHRGVINLSRDSNKAFATAEEIMGLDFLIFWCGFNGIITTGISYYTEYCLDRNHTSTASNSTLLPNIWPSVNLLTKAMYFSLLADLGRDNSSGPNMLADPTLLANLSQNLTQINETLTQRTYLPAPPALQQISFDASQSLYQLGVSPSILGTNFLCQIPRLKSSGTLFVSVFVADLVILQALWTIFTFVVSTFFVKKKAELRTCEGCVSKDVELKGFREDDTEPLVN